MNYRMLAVLHVMLCGIMSVGQAQASPLQPWDQYHCAPIIQGNGVKIGAICGGIDHNLQVQVLDVYYFGYLWQKQSDYLTKYVNLSVDGGFFARKGLVAKTFGDGSNLPRREVLTTTYVVSTSIDDGIRNLEGKPFQIYFQAEQDHPTHNPPFDFDNMFGNNYRGKLGRINY